MGSVHNRTEIQRVPQSLGERLAELRVARGTTQAAIAEACGVSRPTVTQWETGVKRPSRDNVLRLANALAVSLDDLLRGTDLAPPHAATQDESEALALLRRATPPVRQAVLTILRQQGYAVAAPAEPEA